MRKVIISPDDFILDTSSSYVVYTEEVVLIASNTNISGKL